MRGIKRQGYAKGIRHLSQQPCSECGWDKGPTDKHRIDPSRGYEADNLVPLCPNCHRLVTLELINV